MENGDPVGALVPLMLQVFDGGVGATSTVAMRVCYTVALINTHE